MESFISQLFYDNICAQGKTIPNEHYQRAMAAIEQNESRLLELLGEQERGMVLDLSNNHGIVSGYELERRFVQGFRLGARFMLDALSGEEELLE